LVSPITLAIRAGA